MPLVASDVNPSAKMEATIEQVESLPLGLLVGIIRADEMFDLFGQEAADGRVALRREDLCPEQRLAIEANRDVLFAVGSAHGAIP
jgi:hypothetical protein